MRREYGKLYFRKCFICGATCDECGHRERELVMWWRSRPAGIPALSPEFYGTELAGWEVTEEFPRAPLPVCHPNTVVRLPRALTHVRMPWPTGGVTPEMAYRKRA